MTLAEILVMVTIFGLKVGNHGVLPDIMNRNVFFFVRVVSSLIKKRRFDIF